MKIHIRFGFVLLCFALLALPLIHPIPTRAADCLTDESNYEVDEDSAALTLSNHDLGQSFRPTGINMLGSTRIFLRGFTTAQTLTLTLMKMEPTPTEVVSSTGVYEPELFFGGEVNPNSWVTTSWTHGGDMVIDLVPEARYTLYVESDGAAMWARSGYNAYARGAAEIDGSTDLNDDFGFSICGDYVAASTSTSTSSTTSSVSTASTTSTTTTTSTTSSTTSTESEVTYDTPILTSLTQNGEEIVGLDELYTLSIDETDTLLLTGQGAAEKYIVVTIGDYGDISDYIDSDGIWQVEVTFLGISNETLTISAYVTDDDSISSDVVEFFDVEVLGTSSGTGDPVLISAQDTTPTAAASSIVPYIIALVAIGVVGIIIVIVIVVLIKKRSTGKGSSTDSKEMVESPKDEIKVEEVKVEKSEVPPVPTV